MTPIRHTPVNLADRYDMGLRLLRNSSVRLITPRQVDHRPLGEGRLERGLADPDRDEQTTGPGRVGRAHRVPDPPCLR